MAQTSLPLNLHAESVICDLRDRLIGGLVQFPDATWRSILITAGQLVIRRADHDDLTIDGPALVWMPWASGMRLLGRAGTMVTHVLMTDLTLANAIGHKPESTELRALAQRVSILPLGRDSAAQARLQQCFAVILDELAENGPGAEILAEAQVRMILILLWRQSLRDVQGPRPALHQHRILPAFRQLIEAHFRDRWTIARYAAQLNITPDRLHDICTKVLGRTPRLLVQQRLTYEAQLLLERSSKSMDQIAHDLGFKTAAHFNRAFAKATGQPPARYRKSRQRADTAPIQSETFADWP